MSWLVNTFEKVDVARGRGMSVGYCHVSHASLPRYLSWAPGWWRTDVTLVQVGYWLTLTNHGELLELG